MIIEATLTVTTFLVVFVTVVKFLQDWAAQ